MIKKLMIKDKYNFFFVGAVLFCIFSASHDYKSGYYKFAMWQSFCFGLNLAALIYYNWNKKLKKTVEQSREFDRRHIKYLEETIDCLFDGDKEKLRNLSDDYLEEIKALKKNNRL